MKKILHLRNRGFTLIELLVVIAIIGILATLLLLQLNIARQKARDVKRIADITQIRTAIELYFEVNDFAYPPDISSASLGKYMKSGVVPGDPLGGTSYFYGFSGSPVTKYQVYAKLELKSSALNSDDDIDGSSWTGGVNGGPANEVCDTRDKCIFDLGSN